MKDSYNEMFDEVGLTPHYEITSADTGRSIVLNESQARRRFGRDEWEEIKAGYLPHLIVCQLD